MAFATPDDLAARIGATLSSAQEDQADAALDAASEIVAAELDTTADAISDPSELIRQITISLAIRIYSNPENTSSQQEHLGAYRIQRIYNSSSHELTKTESLILRRAQFGATSGSSRPASTSDEVYDFLYYPS